jgi:methionine aminopeptidase
VFNWAEFGYNGLSEVCWNLDKEIKICVQFCVPVEDVIYITSYIDDVFSSLKYKVLDSYGDPEYKLVYIYKFDFVETLLGHIMNDVTHTTDIYHILNGLMFGIPSHLIQEHLLAIETMRKEEEDEVQSEKTA